MDVLELLDEIEDIVEAAKPAFFSNKVAVSKEEVLDLISELRIKLPDDIKQATWIKEERERILNEARMDSDRIINEAKIELGKLLSEESVMIEAKERAEELLRNTSERAKKIYLDSINHSDKVMLTTQENLKNIIAMINDNRQKLNDLKTGKNVREEQ